MNLYLYIRYHLNVISASCMPNVYAHDDHMLSWIHRDTIGCCMCAMTHSYMCQDSFICVPWLIPMCAMIISMCAMTYSYIRHDSFLCEYAHMLAWVHWDTIGCCKYHDSFIYVPWLILMCTMTHSYVCCTVFTFVPWLISMFAMTCAYVRHDSFLCVPWLINMRAIP